MFCWRWPKHLQCCSEPPKRVQTTDDRDHQSSPTGDDRAVDGRASRGQYAPQIFVRSGALVRVRQDERERPWIEPYSESQMRFRMDQVANYMRSTDRRSFKTAPPAAVVQNVLAMGSWPFPALEGVVEVPVMRPDGTVLDRPGYDPTTKLFYLPAAGLRLPPIPRHPTQSDAREALRVLKGVFSDFPFDDDASRESPSPSCLHPCCAH